MKIKYIIFIVLIFLIFDDLFYLYTNISIAGKISSIFLSLFILLFFRNNYFSKTLIKAFSFFVILIFYHLLLQVLFNFDTFSLLSFIYETYKLGIFFSLFILILLNRKDSTSVIHFSFKLFSIFIILNFIVLIFQHLFGANVIKYIGIHSSALDFQILKDRPSGITTGANTVGDSSLFIFIIFSYFLMKKNEFKFSLQQIKYIKYMRYLTIFTVILSTSKNALLILLLYPIFLGKVSKKTLLPVFILSIISIYFLYIYNIYGINDKLSMYKYIINNYNSFDSKLIEHRGLSLLNGLHIFEYNFPLGTGLGTWGDYSSSFNKNLGDSTIKMSDSYAIHLLVEQGVFVIFYFIILFFLVKQDSLGIYAFISLCLIFLPTMGFGSSTVPYIFSFFLFLIHNRHNKSRLCM